MADYRGDRRSDREAYYDNSGFADSNTDLSRIFPSRGHHYTASYSTPYQQGRKKRHHEYYSQDSYDRRIWTGSERRDHYHPHVSYSPSSHYASITSAHVKSFRKVENSGAQKKRYVDDDEGAKFPSSRLIIAGLLIFALVCAAVIPVVVLTTAKGGKCSMV